MLWQIPHSPHINLLDGTIKYIFFPRSICILIGISQNDEKKQNITYHSSSQTCFSSDIFLGRLEWMTLLTLFLLGWVPQTDMNIIPVMAKGASWVGALLLPLDLGSLPLSRGKWIPKFIKAHTSKFTTGWL